MYKTFIIVCDVSVCLLAYVGFCRWYCHFDDDVYVNLPVLTKDLLLKYNPYDQSLYFGQSYGYKFQVRYFAVACS